MFSRKPQITPARLPADFWRKLTLLPYERQSAETSYRFIIGILEGVVVTPVYYLYTASTGTDMLGLDHMELRLDRPESAAFLGTNAELIELLQTPEAQIRMDADYKTLRYVELGAGTFLNLPLLGDDGSFIATIVAGPCEPKQLDKSTDALLHDFSAAFGSTVQKLREIIKLQEDLRIASARARVTQRVLGSTLEVDRFVSLLLDLALTASKTEAGFVAIAGNDQLTVRAAKNIPDEFLSQVNLSLTGGLFEWSRESGDILILQDYEFIARFGIRSILAVPLVEEEHLHGIFALINFMSNKTFEEQSLVILRSFCEQIKLVLRNSKLFEDFTDSYLATLKALSESYDIRSPYGAGHSTRVAATALKIAKELDLPLDDMKHLELAAQIHDVGMCGVIEIKSGFRADFNHPTIGASLIEVLPISADVTDAIRTHHEWFDGWGYPEGLKGEAIPILGRILAVAEYYEEIQSGELHEKLREPGRLEEDLETRSGTQFDPNVINALKRVLEKR
ncbi:MAG TPA: HD domain-containing phosphohydrolase [Bacteroidota bacterium]|nr:HD domain-containing phosphohydrolase [Bacteroidota bacterium]